MPVLAALTSAGQILISPLQQQHHQQRSRLPFLLLLLLTILFFSCFLPLGLSDKLQFSYSTFSQNENSLNFSQQSNVDNQALQITRNSGSSSADISDTSGQITYWEPLQLWNRGRNYSASFNTSFLMNTSPFMGGGSNDTGGGMAFMLSSALASVVPKSSGEWLGLYDDNVNQTNARRVGIELDTFKDSFDPDANHVGIDVNGSVHSVAVKSLNEIDVFLTDISNSAGINTSVWIEYDGKLHTLKVYLANQGSDILRKPATPALSYDIDLRNYLPETVYVGFSASLGTILEAHCVLRWNFTSTDFPHDSAPIGLIIGLSIGGVFIALLVVLAVVLLVRRRRRSKNKFLLDDLTDLHYGPRKFPYRELKKATRGFSDECKLGQGGFGAVYKGELMSSNGVITEVAVKCLSQKSKQGEREFKAEVMSMGRMKHRNLVQLLGWSYESNRLMLVYQYMPNGSLDEWIKQGEEGVEVMGWERRYHVMKGLAAGLLYLHEEWEMVVIHRDLKPSNVMLDAEFNARIGDFGLAKFIDMEQDMAQTATIAGTPGYIAPECLEQGIVSKETDVYSLGAIAIELATGRRISISFLHSLSYLLENSSAQEAADPRLPSFDPTQLELLLRLGLACCHPNPLERPSIREVMHALSSAGAAQLSAIPSLSSFSSSSKPCYSDADNCTSSISAMEIADGR